jgi:hypothetical protein
MLIVIIISNNNKDDRIPAIGTAQNIRKLIVINTPHINGIVLFITIFFILLIIT